MFQWLLYPPVAFFIILAVFLSFSAFLSRLSYRNTEKVGAGSRKAYACGEDIAEHKVQVDWSQFFPFAFFFTILHVVALMIATVPVETMDSLFIAVIYIIGAVTGLVVLFRR